MTARRYSLPRSHRLSGKPAFDAVFAGRVRESRGPLTVHARPNERAHLRMGLVVSRRVGTAPRRNRIKRLLRESFRLMQHDLPRGYDIAVVVRPHEPLRLPEYQRLLSALLLRLHRHWTDAPDPGES